MGGAIPTEHTPLSSLEGQVRHYELLEVAHRADSERAAIKAEEAQRKAEEFRAALAALRAAI